MDRMESKLNSAEGEAELSCGAVPMKAVWELSHVGPRSFKYLWVD